MNHSTPEEWIDYNEPDLPPARRAELDRHLAGCAECRARLADWSSARAALAEWTLPAAPAAAPTRATPAPAPLWPRWAAAAALLLCGCGLGLLLARPGEAERRQWADAARQELRAELAAFTDAQLARQDQFQRSLTQTLGSLEARRLEDYHTLRQEVETLAVQAADEFAGTRQSLARLSPNP